MEAGDVLRQKIDVPAVEVAAQDERACERVLWKFAHPECVVENCAVATHLSSVRVPPDFHDAVVDVRRKPPVQAQLFVAEMPPRFERSEVKKTQGDRLLDLVSPLARQENP